MNEYQSLVTTAAISSTAAASLKDKLPREIAWLSRSCFPQKVDVKLGEIKDMIIAAKDLEVEDLQEVNFDRFPREAQAELVRIVVAMRHLDMADWIVSMVEGTLKKLGVPEHYYMASPADPAAPAQQ